MKHGMKLLLFGLITFFASAGLAYAHVNHGYSTLVRPTTNAQGEECVEFTYVWTGDCSWVSQQGNPAKFTSPATGQNGATYHQASSSMTWMVWDSPDVKSGGSGGLCWKRYKWIFCFEVPMQQGDSVTMQFNPYTDPNDPNNTIQPSPRTYTKP